VIVRALAVWGLLLVLAVLNGGVRDTWLSPVLGDTIGRAISSVLLALLILLATWLTIRWIGPTTPGQAMAVGALWVGLTLGFEFGVGHYGFGKSWAELLADYDLLRGRIWILVLLATFVAPMLTFTRRGH
jgi:hypothetical protein